LILDGDEELDSGCLDSLKETIEQNVAEGYLVKVVNYYNSGPEVLTSDDIVFRLFRNKKAYRYTGAIHEQICDNIRSANPKAKIEINEEISIIHYGYLISEIAEKNKVERNTKLLEEAVRKNPESLLDRHHLGVEYFRANQMEKALEHFHWVYSKVDQKSVYVPKLLRLIATCMYSLGKHEETLSFIDNVWIKHFNDHGDLYYLRGLICKDLGRFAEAYNSFKKCLEVPPQPAYYSAVYSQHKHKIQKELEDAERKAGK
jgi:tetratricopeptide (TPR) repeat protein